jgi:hypothetical protein
MATKLTVPPSSPTESAGVVVAPRKQNPTKFPVIEGKKQSADWKDRYSDRFRSSAPHADATNIDAGLTEVAY